MIEHLQRSEDAGGRQRIHRRESPRGKVDARIEIVPATLAHAERLHLRLGDAREVAACGLSKEQAISLSLERSLWAETYIADGEVAAIVGLGLSAVAGGHGVPWLLTGPACERHKRRFMVESRRQVARMLAQAAPLINYVHADYGRALRWLEWLGFRIDPPRNGFCRAFKGAA